MATIRPFKGYRPTEELCSKVAALPYDVMTSAEAREMVKDDPYSFLHVDRAEIDLPVGTDIYSEVVYKKAADNLNSMIEKGIYIRDEKPVYYIYSLKMGERVQTGLVVCTSIDEYIDGTIKKHELTRADKEQDRINHVDYCNANTGPIFLTYRDNDKVNDIIAKETAKKPVYDFVSDDGVGHKVWLVDSEETITALTQEFKNVPNLYIADGHHRNASAVKVGLKRRGEGEYDKNAEFNFYLSVLFPVSNLHIMDYNRVVKDLNGLTKEEFFAKVSEKFDVEEKPALFHPEKMHTFGMYIDKKWYCLSAKKNVVPQGDPVGELDVSILQENLLSPILGIGDPRTDKRIDFVGGIRGLEELVKDVDEKGWEVAFAMYPTTMTQLLDVADNNKIMPPKSTWFEPKLRSGIFVHKLSD
ncbi:MAG: DUF1015 domain-containing protein [Firmicutes bacterium]|nr:DUF1015 domain-containing protein [Bacillota bacterium]